jgi:hypothetical protein
MQRARERSVLFIRKVEVHDQAPRNGRLKKVAAEEA